MALVTSSRRNFGLWCVNALYDLLLPLLISVRNTSNSMYWLKVVRTPLATLSRFLRIEVVD